MEIEPDIYPLHVQAFGANLDSGLGGRIFDTVKN